MLAARNLSRRALSGKAPSLAHFAITQHDGVAVVRMDSPNEPVIVLSESVMKEMPRVLDYIESEASITSAVLISAKPGCFIAGADIKMLSAATSADQVEKELCLPGHALMDRLENGKPIVAAIDGACLGGGLEVALACAYRVCATSSKTKLALPEVQLGLLPGAGGTQRFPKLVGLQEALKGMTTGKNYKPAQAKKIGLVDQLADPSALESAAIAAARDLAEGRRKPSKKKAKSLFDRLLEDNPLGRKVLFKKAREAMMKASGGHYPAPKAIIDCIEKGASSGGKEGYALEAREFGKLTQSGESKALISIFNGMTAMKKNRFGKVERRVDTIGVLGAGLMGAGIAQVSAQAKLSVLLKDRDAAGLGRGEAQIASNLAGRVKRRAMTSFERDMMAARVVGLTDDEAQWKRHFAKADLVVEAVFEDLGLKHTVVKEMEAIVPEHCVIATNTSALPIADIAKAAARPENVIGMHYFSPVDKMPLLEIIRHEGTSDETAARAVDVGLRQGKTVVVVKDVPGFYVNRCLGPYMSEMSALLADGCGVKELDVAIKKLGFPMGPMTLADEVGLDVASHVQSFLSSAPGIGDRMVGSDAAFFDSLVQRNILGKKSGAGFFTYTTARKGGKTSKALNPEVTAMLQQLQAGADKEAIPSEEDIQMRVMSRFVNEAVHCLQDDIIASPTDGDIAMIFGTGFPPFSGGPFRWIDAFGAQNLVDVMHRYGDAKGVQFTPAQLLIDHANANTKFHSK
jgi:enoyl-CoA hydratase/long-chain 3-hydroxyacyl-CoA dehydrogenase